MVHLYSRAALHLKPGQVLRPAPSVWRTSVACAGACTQMACVVLTFLLLQKAPAAGVCLAPAHIPVPPAASALVHAHCPHACRALTTANDHHAAVSTAPFEALTARWCFVDQHQHFNSNVLLCQIDHSRRAL